MIISENTGSSLLLQHISRDVEFHLDSGFLGERDDFWQLDHELRGLVEVVTRHNAQPWLGNQFSRLVHFRTL